jgi:glycosyltransferase involved in cell wall biosynthesis
LARERKLCPEMIPHFALCFEGRLSAELRQVGVPLHSLGEVRIRRPWTIWRARRKLAAILKNQSFDLAFCHSVWTQAIFGPLIRSTGLRLIFWLHDSAEGTHWLERWAKRTPPSGIICNSHITAQGLPRLFPGVAAKTVYCPVAIPRSSFSVANRQAARAELNTPQDAVVIIQVSRMESLKGHRLHLQALGRLADLPGWHCWQVGGAQRSHEKRYLAELKLTATRLNIADRVHFLGERMDVPRLLAAANIHCQPNAGPESFGITFIEGLLAGLPVVTTAIGGALEIVDPSCGILIPPDDPMALATALRRLILDNSLRASLGGGGPRRARALCDPRQQIHSIYDFGNRLIGLAGHSQNDSAIVSVA